MDPTAQLIGDAYEIVSQPDKLLEIRRRLAAKLDEGDLAPLTNAEVHFGRAAGLLDADGARPAEFIDPFGDAADQPHRHGGLALLIDCGPVVVQADERLFDRRDLAPGDPLPDWLWHAEQAEGADSRFRALANRGEELAGSVVRLRRSPDDERGALFTVDSGMRDDRPHLFLRHLALRWDDEAGAAFARLMKLSPGETRVLQWLVAGGTLRDLAEERGTALGTVRNQAKAMLRKLGMASQVEAVCLWAGFRQQFQAAREQEAEPAPTVAATGQLPLRIERHGQVGGRPVLFFHPLIGGALATRELHQALASEGLDVVTPWRPGFGGTLERGDPFDMVRDFVDAVPRLLEKLVMPQVRVLGASGGSVFALAFAARHPHLVKSVVIAGPTVPLKDRADFAKLGAGQRLPLQLARMAPTISSWYVRAVLARLRREGAAEYVQEFFSGSPDDLDWFRQPEAREFVREALRLTYAESPDCGVAENALTSRNWSTLFEGITAPVHVLHGAQDMLAPPALVHSFAEANGFCSEGPVPGTGSLLLYQQPALVAARLRGN